MPPEITYKQDPHPRYSVVREQDIETDFLEKLRSLKYTDRPDIRDRAALEKNFREKFEALNRVRLTDAEFQRLLDELITPDVFTAARVLRHGDNLHDRQQLRGDHTNIMLHVKYKNTLQICGGGAAPSTQRSGCPPLSADDAGVVISISSQGSC